MSADQNGRAVTRRPEGEPKTCFSTPWFEVEELTFAGDEPYYRFVMPDAAVVLPIDADGNFVLIRQYREVAGRKTLEIPAGDIDAGETAETTALREMFEETGYRSDELVHLGTGTLRLNRDKGLVSYFVALGAYRDPEYAPNEPIETVVVSPAEFRDLLARNAFDHISALSLFVLAEVALGKSLISVDG